MRDNEIMLRHVALEIGLKASLFSRRAMWKIHESLWEILSLENKRRIAEEVGTDSVDLSQIRRAVFDGEFESSLLSLIELQIIEISESKPGKTSEIFESFYQAASRFDLNEKEVKFLELVYIETFFDQTPLGKFISYEPDITQIYTSCSFEEADKWCERTQENPFVERGIMTFKGPREVCCLTDQFSDILGINKEER